MSRGHGAPQILKYSLSGSFQKPLAQRCSAAPPLCAGGVVPAVPWPPACRAWSCPHCPACVPPPFSVSSLPLLPDAAIVLLNRLQTHVCALTHMCILPGAHGCSHTRTHTCTHTHARTRAAHVCSHTHMRTHTHALLARAHMHTRILISTRMCSCTCTHVCAHTHVWSCCTCAIT